jgi:hypothetical protein
VELTPCGQLLLAPSPLSLISDLVHGHLCPLLGCSSLYPFVLVSPLLASDYDIYDNLRLRIEGESPDGAPHTIISKSYRSMMCAQRNVTSSHGTLSPHPLVVPLV